MGPDSIGQAGLDRTQRIFFQRTVFFASNPSFSPDPTRLGLQFFVPAPLPSLLANGKLTFRLRTMAPEHTTTGQAVCVCERPTTKQKGWIFIFMKMLNAKCHSCLSESNTDKEYCTCTRIGCLPRAARCNQAVLRPLRLSATSCILFGNLRQNPSTSLPDNKSHQWPHAQSPIAP